MSHAVLVLDDEVGNARATIREILIYDAGAEILREADVEAAKQTLSLRHSDIGYVVVDLLMLTGDVQGTALVTWILAQEELAHLPILVLTQHSDMTKTLPKKHERHAGRVTTVIMTADMSEMQEKFSAFIEHARAAFTRRRPT